MNAEYQILMTTLSTQPNTETHFDVSCEIATEDGTKIKISKWKSSKTLYKQTNRPDGTSIKITLFEDGSKKVEETNKDKCTDIIQYNSTGTVVRKFSTDENGRQSGLDQSFWDNGKPCEETYYCAGVPEGHFVTYYENGKVKEQGCYRNGRVEEITEYRKNGKVSEYGSGGFSIGEGRMRKGYSFGSSGRITKSWNDDEDPWWYGLDEEYDRDQDDQEEYLDEPKAACWNKVHNLESSGRW